MLDRPTSQSFCSRPGTAKQRGVHQGTRSSAAQKKLRKDRKVPYMQRYKPFSIKVERWYREGRGHVQGSQGRHREVTPSLGLEGPRVHQANGVVAAAAAKSLQSCPTVCDPIDCSPPGSSVHGIFQASVLEWGAIAFSNW